MERARFLLQQKAEGAHGPVRAQTLADRSGRVKPNLRGGRQHPLHSRLAHGIAAVQHAVDSGYADAGGAGEVGDRGSVRRRPA
jgi:hypothetical protein